MGLTFILSGTRSGSTLLARILDSHPEIACPFEFMIPYLLPPLHWKRRQAKAKLKRIIDHYQISVPKIWLWFGIPFHRYLDVTVGQICEAERKRMFIAKDPFYARILEKMSTHFPDAKYIILLRHPLKVAQSIQDTWQNDKGLRMWTLHYEQILRHRSRIGHLLIKYEDLVSEPETTIRSVCDYLEVDFVHQMIDYSNVHHADDELGLWGVTSTDERVSRTLKSVAEGRIDPALAELDLARIDKKYVIQLRNNAYNSRTIAEAFGYSVGDYSTE